MNVTLPAGTQEGAGTYGSIGQTAFQDSRIKLMIDQDYIDGTMEDIVRNRLIMTNEIYNTYDKSVNVKYKVDINNKVVNRIKNSF